MNEFIEKLRLHWSGEWKVLLDTIANNNYISFAYNDYEAIAKANRLVDRGYLLMYQAALNTLHDPIEWRKYYYVTPRALRLFGYKTKVVQPNDTLIALVDTEKLQRKIPTLRVLEQYTKPYSYVEHLPVVFEALPYIVLQASRDGKPIEGYICLTDPMETIDLADEGVSSSEKEKIKMWVPAECLRIVPLSEVNSDTS